MYNMPTIVEDIKNVVDMGESLPQDRIVGGLSAFRHTTDTE